jgi:hypothetical protein
MIITGFDFAKKFFQEFPIVMNIFPVRKSILRYQFASNDCCDTAMTVSGYCPNRTYNVCQTKAYFQKKSLSPTKFVPIAWL